MTPWQTWKQSYETAWLEEASVAQLQSYMEEGRTTSERLVLGYLYRIATRNRSGPMYNAVLEVNPDAVHIARALDAERLRSGPRGPLHGIPILLKDNLDTGDQMRTSGGSLALADARASRDAFVVGRLRDAGAVILGKANMTELANFMAKQMPSGYSSRGGQVLNPYGPGRFDVGGSSSGSAAAVAANLTALAVGTETSGSILNPAVQNALVGIKPTVGLVSRTGIMPISFSQDTAGPLARTVEDAVVLLEAMAGPDADDPVTLAQPAALLSNLRQALRADVPAGLRVAVCTDGMERDGDGALLRDAVHVLQQLGVGVTEDVHIPTFHTLHDVNVLLYEFKAAFNAYLARRLQHPQIRTLADLIAFHRAHPQETLKYGQFYLTEAEQTTGTLTEPIYLESRLRDLHLSREAGIDYVLHEHSADAIVFAGDAGADISARAGYPSVAVPAGYTVEGEPFGITFTGSAFSEPVLIRLAYAFEQATRHRKKPPADWRV